MKTIVGVFQSPEAERAVTDLMMMGIPDGAIQIAYDTREGSNDWARPIGNRHFTKSPLPVRLDHVAPAGALAGLLVAVAGALAAYGLPITLRGLATFAAFALGGLVVGTAAASIVGLMFRMGAPPEVIPMTAEAAREHGTVVAAHVSEADESSAWNVLHSHGARQLRIDRDPWIAAGWAGNHPTEHDYPLDSSFKSHEVAG